MLVKKKNCQRNYNFFVWTGQIAEFVYFFASEIIHIATHVGQVWFTVTWNTKEMENLV